MTDESSAGGPQFATASAAVSPTVKIAEQRPKLKPTASPEDALKRIHEAHERERQVLFGNEAFAINALQVVSGGSVIAIIGQFEAIQKAANPALVVSRIDAVVHGGRRRCYRFRACCSGAGAGAGPNSCSSR